MPRAWPIVQQCVLVLVLSGRTAATRADSLPVLNEPTAEKQDGKPWILVQEDGSARLRLAWSNGDEPKPTVDVSLSPFVAQGQPKPVVVGVGDAKHPDATHASLSNAIIGPGGGELLLLATDLAFDVDYAGKLSLLVRNKGKPQLLNWDLTLYRPSAVPMLRCPSPRHVVEADGTTHIEVETYAASDATLALGASAFVSSDNERGQVGFVSEAGSELQLELQKLAVVVPRTRLPLRASGLSEGVSYNGSVWFARAGHRTTECPLELVMAKSPRGELVTDVQVLTRNITLPFWASSAADLGSDGTLSVRLFEKTRTRRVDGITALLDGVSEAPNGTFDLERHVAFQINGKPVPTLTQLHMPITELQEQRSRTLHAGEQFHVMLQLRDLQAGKYSFAVRFTSQNAAATTPKIDITANARHHVAWAVIAVFCALLISFVLSTGIVNWRERVNVRRRVYQMQEETFGGYTHLPSVVFLRAVLAQTLKLLEHVWFVPPPPSVYNHLARAERVVTILRVLTPLYDTLAKLACPPSVKGHFRDSIADIMGRIGMQPLEQSTADAIVSELSGVALMLKDPLTAYWTPLKASAKALVDRVQRSALLPPSTAPAPGTPPDPVGQMIRDLVTLVAVPPPDPASDIDHRFEHSYWFLKLLYDRRESRSDLEELIKDYRVGDFPAKAFKIGDEQSWKRLQAAIHSEGIKITLVDSTDELVSLRPTKFSLNIRDEALADSFLVRHLLSYEWKFVLTPTPKTRRGWGRAKTSEPSISPTIANGMRFTYFAPGPGKLAVSVTIRRSVTDQQGNDSSAPITLDVPVRDNTELSVWKTLQGEFVLMGIVFAVTLATSLPALYFSKAAFGTFSDYAAILVWAIGVDQGKNLIQMLNAFKANDASTSRSAGS